MRRRGDDVTSNDAPGETNPLKGIGLKVLSVAVMVNMLTLIKASGDVPPGQIVFFRSAFALLPILLVFAWRRELRCAFHTATPWGHVLRGLVGVASMGLSFFAITRLPLPEAVTLNYAQPLMVVIFGALFLGETIRIFRWSAVTIGMIGVVIVSWPKLTLFGDPATMGSGQAIGVVAALLAAMMSAIAMLLVRHLVSTERTSTIVIWFSITATVLSLCTVPFGWAPLSMTQTVLLVAAGICGGVGQILLTESYRYAEVSTVAPFEYSSLLLAIAAGFFVFGEVPTTYTIVGGTIVVCSGIFIIWREHRLGLERGRARRVTPPQ